MYLHALGHFHPENVIDNQFLENLGIDTNEQWIMERVGIRSRHTVLSLDYIRETKNKDPRGAVEAATMSNAQTGAEASKLALQRAGLTPKDIGLVLAGGCSPDECIPAESNRIAAALDIDAPCIDVSAACSSFAAQLWFLDAMKPERVPEYVLVVNPENSTRVVDYSDRSSCVLWGDASSAAVVSLKTPGRWKVLKTYLGGDPSGADKVVVPRLGHFTQQGPAVQAFGVRRGSETYGVLLEAWKQSRPGRDANNLQYIGHQANLRMLEAIVRRSDIPPSVHVFNVDKRGNTGAAGAPSVLSERWDDPSLGDGVALTVVGSGLTWAGALLERNRQ
jgi:3-oxoacyl-[acyl-carrier-protein] synthase III